MERTGDGKERDKMERTGEKAKKRMTWTGQERRQRKG